MYHRELEVVTTSVQEASRLLLAEGNRPDGPRGSNETARVDLEIGRFLAQRIRRAFPEDSIICEETGEHRGSSGRAFIVDPHDGTADFLRGSRETSVSVALVERSQLLLGVVVAPFQTELTGPAGLTATWVRGGPLQLDGRKLRPTSGPTLLGESTVVLVSRNLTQDQLESNKRLLSPAQILQCSSIATRLALVAVGKADLTLTINTRLAPWDFAGGQALLEGAGGHVIGPEGKRIDWIGTEVRQPLLPGYFGARNMVLATRAATAFRSKIRM